MAALTKRMTVMFPEKENSGSDLAGNFMFNESVSLAVSLLDQQLFHLFLVHIHDVRDPADRLGIVSESGDIIA
jgi:hypothetical protein